MKLATPKRRTLKVRKNGKKAIDAASTMRLPLGLNRIIQPKAALRWMGPNMGAFTPRYIEGVLNGALSGYYTAQWELFDLMLRTWPALAACHQELINGVTRRELVYDPYREEDEEATDSAIEREKLVTHAIRSMSPDPTRDENAISGTIKDIMDAWFRGISVLEIIWRSIDTQKHGTILAPESTNWVQPYMYGLDEGGRLGLDLTGKRSGYAPGFNPSELTPFPPNKFLIAMHKAKAGYICGGAMFAPLAWWWCASNFSSDWLLNLAQVFGIPFRWASYASSSPDTTITALCNMLQNMGSAGWAAFPEGTTMELKEASTGTGGHTPQGDLLDRADNYARLIILGQTMTGQTIASGRGGQAFGTVEAQLKQDRLDAACAIVAEVINRQLIPAILAFNYGNSDEAPTCRFLQESEGTYQDAQRDQILTSGLGLKIPISHLRQKYNIPQPTGDEEVTEPPPKPVAPSNISAGPKGTSPISKEPPVESKQETQLHARMLLLNEIKDDAIFSAELSRLAGVVVSDPPEPKPEPQPPPPPQVINVHVDAPPPAAPPTRKNFTITRTDGVVIEGEIENVEK